MQSRSYSVLLKYENKYTVLSKFKITALLFIVAIYLPGCSNSQHIDLISMSNQKLEESIPKKAGPLQVDIFNELAYRYSWDGNKDALNYAKKAMQTAKEIKYQRGIVDARCMQGMFYFLKGDFDRALSWYKKGKELAEKIKYRTGKAMAYTGIGRYHQVRGEFSTALKKFLHSEGICKNSSNKIDKRVLAQTYYGLGALYYYDPQDYKEAGNYFEKFRKLGEEIKDQIIITSGYYSIGEMQLNSGEHKKAEKSFFECLKRSREIELKYNMANAHEGLGDVYIEQKDYKKALEKYKESLKLFEDTGNKFQVAEIKRRLGKLYNKMGDNEANADQKIKNYREAKEYLMEAFDFAQKANIPKTIERVCEEIIRSCEKLGKYREASQYYESLLETREFLRDNEMSILKLKLDIEKNAQRERIITISSVIGFIVLFIALVVVLKNSFILKKQKTKIEDQTQKLAEALVKEKEISNHKDDLMYTVSHQYKTPLAIMDSSTRILKEYLPNLSKEQIRDHLGKILSNLEKMTHLIDQLLKFGKKFNPDYYDLHKICSDLIEEINTNEGTEHDIEFNSSVGCTKIKLDKDFMKIMVHNLVLNSIKYSKKGSKISVELLCNDEYAVIKVRDNGMGIPDDYLNMQYERFHRGSNVSTIPGTGLGLSIVKRYTDLHSGTISIDTKLNSGTTVTIKIPKNT